MAHPLELEEVTSPFRVGERGVSTNIWSGHPKCHARAKCNIEIWSSQDDSSREGIVPQQIKQDQNLATSSRKEPLLTVGRDVNTNRSEPRITPYKRKRRSPEVQISKPGPAEPRHVLGALESSSQSFHEYESFVLSSNSTDSDSKAVAKVAQREGDALAQQRNADDVTLAGNQKKIQAEANRRRSKLSVGVPKRTRVMKDKRVQPARNKGQRTNFMDWLHAPRTLPIVSSAAALATSAPTVWIRHSTEVFDPAAYTKYGLRTSFQSKLTEEMNEGES